MEHFICVVSDLGYICNTFLSKKIIMIEFDK